MPLKRCAWNTVEDERERKVLSARQGPTRLLEGAFDWDAEG